MDKRNAENTLFTALSQLRLVVASVEKNLEDLEGEQCQYMDGLFFVLKDSAEKVSSVADFIKAQKEG
jgi:flagellar biosynthesis chaperone FliJ